MGAGETASLSEQIRSRLCDLIARGDIRPGERLVELQLAKAFGVSRSPVRQALNELSAEGMIASQGRRGFVVHGEAALDLGAGTAHLYGINLSQERQWERIYREVEQTVLTEMLHRTVKINELRLAEYFGVSRTVTRDVLARMHGVGIIEKNRSGHWTAAKITPDRIRHLYELRGLLEPHALLQVAPALTVKKISAAKTRIERLLKNSNVDGASFDRVETELHIEIVGSCPNREVVSALERTHVLFAPTRHLSDPVLSIPLAQIEDALREHLEILEHLELGQPERAAARLAEHLSGAVDRWMGRFGGGIRRSSCAVPDYLTDLRQP